MITGQNKQIELKSEFSCQLSQPNQQICQISKPHPSNTYRNAFMSKNAQKNKTGKKHKSQSLISPVNLSYLEEGNVDLPADPLKKAALIEYKSRQYLSRRKATPLLSYLSQQDAISNKNKGDKTDWENGREKANPLKKRKRPSLPYIYQGVRVKERKLPKRRQQDMEKADALTFAHDLDFDHRNFFVSIGYKTHRRRISQNSTYQGWKKDQQHVKKLQLYE